MPLQRALERATRISRGIPVPARYAAGLVLGSLSCATRLALSDILPPDEYPFLLSFPAIIAASLFSGGAGIVATLTASLCAVQFILPPAGTLAVERPGDLLALVVFFLNGVLFAFTVETLVGLLNRSRDNEAELRAKTAELQASERGRLLLLREFRHRMRNDLQSMVGLLLLRARGAATEDARAGLREAAQHCMGLARVHRRLETADASEAGAVIDTHVFIRDLVAEVEAAQTGEGLRPVGVIADAEAHALGTERAVALGMVVNELVTNSFKYAFGKERSGLVRITFRRHGGDYVLCVSDDGDGIAPDAAAGMGSRLLRGLAAQLRGRLDRGPGRDGGTVATLRFPAEGPDTESLRPAA